MKKKNKKILIMGGGTILLVLLILAIMFLFIFPKQSVIDDDVLCKLYETDITKHQTTYNPIFVFNPQGDGTLTIEEYIALTCQRELVNEPEQIVNIENSQFKFVVNSLSMRPPSSSGSYCGYPMYDISVYLNGTLIENVKTETIVNSTITGATSCSIIGQGINYKRYYSINGTVFLSKPDNFKGIEAIFEDNWKVFGGSLNPSQSPMIISTYKIIIPDESTEPIEEPNNESNEEPVEEPNVSKIDIYRVVNESCIKVNILPATKNSTIDFSTESDCKASLKSLKIGGKINPTVIYVGAGILLLLIIILVLSIKLRKSKKRR